MTNVFKKNTDDKNAPMIGNAYYIDTHQSRWGYHPCSYETYLKLKKLNSIIMTSSMQLAAHNRWARKNPANRIRWNWIHNEKNQKIGKVILGPKPEPILPSEHILELFPQIAKNIEKSYIKAKTPCKNPNEVPFLDISIQKIHNILLDISTKQINNISNQA